MEHEILKDFVTVKNVDLNLISRYEKILPEGILSLWKEKGFGTFYGGYLKTINPDEYKSLIESSYFMGDVSIPIFATAFGDILTWEENRYVGILKYRFGENDIISDGFKYFYDIISDNECASDYFTIDKYNMAIKKYGELEYNECFGYVPLLALGGQDSINNLKKVKMREHINLMIELIGEI
ncbi:MAG: DUF1851 domain-containing protein [Oscillospiraceae bacterium]|nr:DUF1851 domain-containing protein [Oscillospiraceae bacterium]